MTPAVRKAMLPHNLPRIFDRALIARRIARRRGDNFVLDLALQDLQERLATVARSFAHAAIVGPDASLLPARGNSGKGSFPYERFSTLVGDEALDAEQLTLPARDYDLIVSVLDLQVVDDVPGFLSRARAHLAPDGLFLAVTLGGATLSELRQAFLAADAELSGGAYARVAPFLDVRDAGGLLQRAGFALPVVDVESHVVRYGSPLALVAELRALGASNPLIDRPSRPATRALLAAASAAYEQISADTDGRVRATLELVWMSGWAPDPTQQKALTPGSARTSLRSVLKDKSDDYGG